MPVQVNLPTVLRSHAGGAKAVTVEGSTVGEVLTALAAQYPGLSGQVIDDDGTLHKFVNVYLNDDDVRYLSSLDTPVEEATRSPSSPPSPGEPWPSGRPGHDDRPRLRAGADREHPAGGHHRS